MSNDALLKIDIRRLITKSNLKWSIRRKTTFIILGATVFSLIMGVPIAFIQHLILETALFDLFGQGIKRIIETYFTIIVNLLVMIVFIGFGIKQIVVKPINKIIEDLNNIQGEQIDLSKQINVGTKDEFNQLANVFNGVLFYHICTM